MDVPTSARMGVALGIPADRSLSLVDVATIPGPSCLGDRLVAFFFCLAWWMTESFSVLVKRSLEADRAAQAKFDYTRPRLNMAGVHDVESKFVLSAGLLAGRYGIICVLPRKTSISRAGAVR